MNIVLVDNEKLSLSDLYDIVRVICPESQIHCFQQPKEALSHIRSYHTHVAFIDIEMPEMDGMELAKQIKNLQPVTNIIFVTGYPQYALDAFSLHASGYLLKPVSPREVENELSNLRSIPAKTPQTGLFIHTFGNFEVFYNNIPLSFKRGKTKELLAYLIDRKGAGCTTAELCAVLWEDKNYNLSIQKQFQTLVSDLLKTLRQVNAEDILIKRRNFLSIDTTKVVCDYYQFLNGDLRAINSYTGEYMTNYSWAEFTTGFLQRVNQKANVKPV